MFDTGTRTSTKFSSAVSLDRIPSLSSFRLIENPSTSVGTTICEIPREPPSSEVRARRHSQSAWRPLVMKVFEPLITHSSPSRVARVRRPATSEPASGSVTAMAATISPATAGRRYCSFSSWLPKRWSDGVAMSLCTLIAMATPRHGMRPSSSPRIAEYRTSPPPPP